MKEKHEAIQDLDEQRAAVTEKLHKLERQHDHTLSEYERARENFSMRSQQNKEEIAALQVIFGDEEIIVVVEVVPINIE